MWRKAVVFIGLFAALNLIVGCAPYVRASYPAVTVVPVLPPVLPLVPGVMVPVPEENIVVYYDDPVHGWFIPGYWTLSGVWVAPFWTTNVVVLHEHFYWYRGRYREHLHRHFNRYPGQFRGVHAPRIRQLPPVPRRHEYRPRQGERHNVVPHRAPDVAPPPRHNPSRGAQPPGRQFNVAPQKGLAKPQPQKNKDSHAK